MLEVRDFTVSYGESGVVDQVGFSAGEGAILAVMGRKGMGKSTLLKSLIGILPSRVGSLKLAGQELAGMPSHKRVEHGQAYVPQGRMVFPALTVMENVLTGLRYRKDSIPEEIFSLFPILREMHNRKAGNLSGGQQQQMVIARALVTNPKVLLLDKPTEGIQPSIIKDLARLLIEIKKLRGLTIVVSEQVLSFALEMADRLRVIKRGHIVDEMTCANADSTTLGRYLSV